MASDPFSYGRKWELLVIDLNSDGGSRSNPSPKMWSKAYWKRFSLLAYFQKYLFYVFFSFFLYKIVFLEENPNEKNRYKYEIIRKTNSYINFAFILFLLWVKVFSCVCLYIYLYIYIYISERLYLKNIFLFPFVLKLKYINFYFVKI